MEGSDSSLRYELSDAPRAEITKDLIETARNAYLAPQRLLLP